MSGVDRSSGAKTSRAEPAFAERPADPEIALRTGTHEPAETALMEPAVPAGARDEEMFDPIVDGMYPLSLPEFALSRMKHWSEDDLKAQLTGDRLRDNVILNKYEFATGATVLKSFPWRLSVPFILCNARCDFCSAWLVRSDPLPLEFIQSLIPVFRHCYEIDMVGWGEPLIHPEIEKIIEIIHAEVDPRARISLTTNGVKLLDWADRLLEAHVKHFAISMHAARADTHDDIMGMGLAAFDKVCAGIRYLASRKPFFNGIKIGAVFIVTQQNIAQVADFIRLGEDMGLDQIFFRTLKPLDELPEGLDYHRLPPYLHPDFEALRAAAVAAIAQSHLHIDATPETWATTVLPKAAEATPLTPRENRLHLVRKIARVEGRTDLPVGEFDPAEAEVPINGNPYGRTPPLRCPSPYTAFYINGFDRAVSPCCYMTKVPRHHVIYYREGLQFDDVWNAPAMVGLRASLHGGPLMDPCLKCPFYW